MFQSNKIHENVLHLNFAPNYIFDVENSNDIENANYSFQFWGNSTQDLKGEHNLAYNNNYVSESFNISAWDLYGSSRLGTRNVDKSFDVIIIAGRSYNWVNNTVTNENLFPTQAISNKKYRLLGAKTFELTNHLGNVISTVSDRKLMVQDAQNIGYVHHYTPEILSIGEQYAFGMSMPSRTFSVEDYRYGFNGKENQDELLGDDNAQDFGARMYDARVGRWWGLDPLASKSSGLSPYSAFANSPILMKDPDGKENVIYLTDLDLQKPDLTPAEYDAIICKLKDIAADANKQYALNGINIFVAVIDYIPNAAELDKSDVLATIGSVEQLIDFENKYEKNDQNTGLNNNEYDKTDSRSIGLEIGTGAWPYQAGNRIAINKNCMNLSPYYWPSFHNFISEIQMFSFLLRHASGHNNFWDHGKLQDIMMDANDWPNDFRVFRDKHNYITPEQKKGFNGDSKFTKRPHFNGKMPKIKLPESRKSKSPKAIGPKAKYNPDQSGKAPSRPPTRRRID
jgi:RHS repeat-associated protein